MSSFNNSLNHRKYTAISEHTRAIPTKSASTRTAAISTTISTNIQFCKIYNTKAHYTTFYYLLLLNTILSLLLLNKMKIGRILNLNNLFFYGLATTSDTVYYYYFFVLIDNFLMLFLFNFFSYFVLSSLFITFSFQLICFQQQHFIVFFIPPIFFLSDSNFFNGKI